jgi:serine/threonine protein kinase
MMNLGAFQDAFRFVDCRKQKKIGEGTFWTVYSGVYRPMAGPPVEVVVKYSHSGSFSRYDFPRTLQTIEMIASLNHPVCIPLLACNLDPHNRPSYVTPRMNMTLHNVLLRVKNSDHPDFFNDTFKSIVSYGIASAFSYLHSRKIVYCDVSLSNILLDANFRPRLCGFSISRNLNDPGAEIIYGGTPGYVSPEISHHDEYDEKADVFGYAMILYELLTGLRSLKSLRFSSLGERPEIPESVNSNYRELITKCWSQLPGDRPSFQSILERPDLLMLESCDRDAFATYQDELTLF